MSDTLYENYDVTTDNTSTVAGAVYILQNFTPSIAHTITSFKWRGYKLNSPGTITVVIYASDGAHKPTGSAIASGTLAASGLTTDTAGAFFEVSLGAGGLLNANTEYCAVIYLSTSSPDVIVVQSKIIGGYAGGDIGASVDSGASWTIYAGVDAVFYEYGIPVSSGPASLKTWDGIAKASIKNREGVAMASSKVWDGVS